MIMTTNNYKYITTKNTRTAIPLEEQDCCSKVSYKEIDITVPLELQPDNDIGKIEIHYCGQPRIECMKESCENGLYIEIKQKAKIVMPIKFKIKSIVNDSFIECEDCIE